MGGTDPSVGAPFVAVPEELCRASVSDLACVMLGGEEVRYCVRAMAFALRISATIVYGCSFAKCGI